MRAPSILLIVAATAGAGLALVAAAQPLGAVRPGTNDAATAKDAGTPDVADARTPGDARGSADGAAPDVMGLSDGTALSPSAAETPAPPLLPVPVPPEPPVPAAPGAPAPDPALVPIAPAPALAPEPAPTMFAEQAAPLTAYAPAPASSPRTLLQRLDKNSVGAAFDLGASGLLPEINLLAVYQPFVWLRTTAGFGYNLVGLGVKGGITVVNPFVIPLSLTGEVGHYFDADANQTIRRFSDQDKDIASLRKIGYQYANLLLGIEGGSGRGRFFFRVGPTFMRAGGKDFAETLRMADVDVSSSSDARVSYRGPTLRLGFVFFFQ